MAVVGGGLFEYRCARNTVRAERVEAQPLATQPTTTRSANEICIHPMVILELACGNLRNRTILVDLQLLPQATVATHGEALAMIEQHKLMGRGVGFVDVHLLASAKLSKTTLWTRDKRLAVIASELGLVAAAELPR